MHDTCRRTTFPSSPRPPYHQHPLDLSASLMKNLVDTLMRVTNRWRGSWFPWESPWWLQPFTTACSNFNTFDIQSSAHRPPRASWSGQVCALWYVVCVCVCAVSRGVAPQKYDSCRFACFPLSSDLYLSSLSPSPPPFFCSFLFCSVLCRSVGHVVSQKRSSCKLSGVPCQTRRQPILFSHSLPRRRRLEQMLRQFVLHPHLEVQTMFLYPCSH